MLIVAENHAQALDFTSQSGILNWNYIVSARQLERYKPCKIIFLKDKEDIREEATRLGFEVCLSS